MSLPPLSASDGVPSEGKIQPQDSVFVRREIHSSATPNLLLDCVIASFSQGSRMKQEPSSQHQNEGKALLLNGLKMNL